ncbi:MAG: cytochrome P450 [Alteraurantiacibacter sp.]
MRLLASEKAESSKANVSALAKSFDPFAPGFLRDPYPSLAKMREKEPVFYSPEIDSWVVTRYQTVRAVLRDTARFSPRIVSDPLTPLSPRARDMIANSEFDVPGLLVNNDTPSPPHCRKFFGEPLKPNRLKSLQPFVEATVSAQIDKMVEQGPPDDLATGLTWEVPALVLFRLLGIPDEDVPQVKEYADSRVVLLWGRPTEEDQIRLTKGALEFFRYTKRLVISRIDNPADDYPSAVLAQRDGDDSVATIRDIIAVTFNLLFAGHETTSSASANILSNILADQELWKGIVDGSVEIAKVVEEGLRFDPPVQAWRRLAKEDVELDGVAIPKGGHVLLHFGAANRDPERFDQPEIFDPDRTNAGQHTSFGIGAHFCLGATLARIEIETMIRQLARRLPDLRLVPDQVPDYLPNTSFRGLRNLQVHW